MLGLFLACFRLKGTKSALFSCHLLRRSHFYDNTKFETNLQRGRWLDHVTRKVMSRAAAQISLHSALCCTLHSATLHSAPYQLQCHQQYNGLTFSAILKAVNHDVVATIYSLPRPFSRIFCIISRIKKYYYEKEERQKQVRAYIKILLTTRLLLPASFLI